MNMRSSGSVTASVSDTTTSEMESCRSRWDQRFSSGEAKSSTADTAEIGTDQVLGPTQVALEAPERVVDPPTPSLGPVLLFALSREEVRMHSLLIFQKVLLECALVEVEGGLDREEGEG